MKILVINSGSSSIKYELFDLDTEISVMNGAVSRIGMKGADHTCACGNKKNVMNIDSSCSYPVRK